MLIIILFPFSIVLIKLCNTRFKFNTSLWGLEFVNIYFFLFFVIAFYIDYSVLNLIDSSVLSLAVVPIKTYVNADIQKIEILKENKGKSGVYRWINQMNGKSYIGSSVNLYIRFLQYFNRNHLLRMISVEKSSSIIYNSLLKNGYSNFTLEILEFSTP